MFDNEGFSLSPINFFQINVDCHQLKSSYPTFKQMKNQRYLLPDTTLLMNEESFASIHMGWSREGIELSMTSNEPYLQSFYPDVTKGNSLELFFDTRNIKTSGFNTKFCHHFFFLPEAVDGQRAGEITKFRNEDVHELADPELLKLQVKKNSKGFSLDIFIPSECLYGYDPEQFKEIGFNYRINRPNGLSQHFSATSSEYSIEQHPSLLASLQLVS